MSTTERVIEDPEVQDRKDEEAEDEEDEEEDDDYNPSEKEDDDDDDEHEYVEDDMMEAAKAGKLKQAKGKGRGKGRAKKGPKSGICLEEEDKAALSTEEAAKAAAKAKEAEEEEKLKAEQAKKRKMDDLWADLNTDSKPKPKTSTSDLWAEMNKPAPKKQATAGLGGLGNFGSVQKANPKEKKLVQITEKADFCGETITVTKKVKEGSKEALEFLKKQGVSGPSGPSGSGVKDAGASSNSPPIAKPKNNLDAIVAGLKTKRKVSTMEKSRMDWGKLKNTMDQQEVMDMEKFSKDGYLEKVAFLNRTDERQADLARQGRRRAMGLTRD